MHKFVLLVCFAVQFAAAAPTEKVSFYFSAHEDDWQLFMNPEAYNDVNSGAKSVFIHVTAGDAGLGLGTGGRKFPYYAARENGAMAAIRFMADADGDPSTQAEAPTVLNGHRLLRIEYKNTVTYFLRLADGNPKGTGYPHTSFESLARLESGATGMVSAIDGSTKYHGWSDLVATFRAILQYERGTSQDVQVGIAEIDEGLNPGDHSDHLTTAKAALAAAKALPCARMVSHIDYASADLPENLTSIEKQIESAVFAVTVSGIVAMDHKSNWDDLHRSWLGRSYQRAQDPTGKCL